MIPKVIHYCWFGRNPIPEEFQLYIDSWRRVMPDYEIKLWNEDNYNINECAYAREAYEAGKWAFVSDYARIDIIYKYGGIYLDTDVEAVKSFDSLLELEGFCGFEVDKDGSKCYPNIGLGLGLGGIIGQKMLKIFREHYLSIHFRKPDGSIDLTPIPVIITKKLIEYGLKPLNETQCINGLVVFPTDYLCPMNQYTGQINITPNTYSIHHYSSTWMSPADRERRKLRIKYSYLGNTASEVVSSVIAYRRHYGIIGMWGNILGKLIGRFRNRNN